MINLLTDLISLSDYFCVIIVIHEKVSRRACLIHGLNVKTPAKIPVLFVVLQLQDCVTLVNPGVSQLCIRGDGKLLASAGWDHRVRVFGWKKLRPLAVLQYHTDMVLSVAFSDHQDPRQRLLAAGSKDQRISLWSIYNEGADTG